MRRWGKCLLCELSLCVPKFSFYQSYVRSIIRGMCIITHLCFHEGEMFYNTAFSVFFPTESTSLVSLPTLSLLYFVYLPSLGFFCNCLFNIFFFCAVNRILLSSMHNIPLYKWILNLTNFSNKFCHTFCFQIVSFLVFFLKYFISACNLLGIICTVW
jgi:hypothetical protein